MRKNGVIEQNRCYHLVSRLAHRAFFLDDEEKDRAVALMRRVEEFSSVVVLAYVFMSNHFHIFIYVPKAEEIGEGEILRRIRVLYHDASLEQVVATWNRLKTEYLELSKRARPTKKYVSRFEAYMASFVRRMWNSAEFMRPSALREAVGIRSPIHFSRYYLRPLMEKGMIERTDPDSPKSPRQEYKLA
ncbi:MAG: transposase [Kiritimatiellae bacterium]|nr:transposase [Kiritimatiellia bacterium]